MSHIKRLIEERLERKGINIYRLAKKMMEKRQLEGYASRLHSTVGKAIDTPEKSRLETIIDIVEALGGKITIEWEDEKKPIESPRILYVERNWKIIQEEKTCEVINIDPTLI